MDLAPPGDLRAALVGSTILFWWPEDGWQRCTVARLCPRGESLHVVAYIRQTSALRRGAAAAAGCTAVTLLDAASYDVRCVLLSPAAGAAHRVGCSAERASLAGPSDPYFQFGLWLVTAWASCPARVEAAASVEIVIWQNIL